jgi:hypothetical protein
VLALVRGLIEARDLPAMRLPSSVYVIERMKFERWISGITACQVLRPPA